MTGPEFDAAMGDGHMAWWVAAAILLFGALSFTGLYFGARFVWWLSTGCMA